tara:strand:+ start:1116 stop:2192 length:1077 start_codon:yes stop_codon:yes gene_type:complete
MKVLQLIDSLNAGGAERVAVNYANSLVSRIETSYLCATRKEGLLKESISKDVYYLFLNKKSTFDFVAIKKLNNFIKDNKIDVMHAHSSSFFLGTLIKILSPNLVLIWHDHYGNSEFLNKRSKSVLKFCSKLFSHAFCVNTKLETWTKKNLKVKTVSYLPNFAMLNSTKPITKLKGVEGKRVICLANMRPQKDHITLLKAFKLVLNKHPDWSLHLIGQDFHDTYSSSVKAFVEQESLGKHVCFYGSCSDANYILAQATIGVLSSKSEGLPLALLEYGLASLPAIATDVGDCNLVISNSSCGQLVPSRKEKDLADALLFYINNMDKRLDAGKNLQLKVLESFSESRIMNSILEIYRKHAI